MVPTAYAATSFECALFETLFHDIDPTAPFKTVSWSSVARLVHSTLSLRRSVDLAALFSNDLMKLGLSRTHLIDTPSSRYAETRCWSEALHGCADRPEGMMWTSRAYDQGTALVLFGDRIDVADLAAVDSRPLATHPDCMAEMLHQAGTAGITIVH